MAIAKARVVRILSSQKAEVEMRFTPPNHECGGCGACGGSQSMSLYRMRVRSDLDVAEGDDVMIEDATAVNLGLWLLAILVPAALLVVGYATWSLLGSLLALSGLPVSFGILHFTVKRRTSRIVALC